MKFVGMLACVPLAGCGGPTAGTPVAESVPPPAQGQSNSSTTTTAPTLDVSPPTTAIPNPAVTGTTFDGCASVTTADEASWELLPLKKRDNSDDGPAGSEGARGCYWQAKKWQIRVYAFDGTIAGWTERYRDRYDRIDPHQFGTRGGIVAEEPTKFGTCTAILPSQQGLAAATVVLGYDLRKQGYDPCPLTVQIMTTIEPKIP